MNKVQGLTEAEFVVIIIEGESKQRKLSEA